MSGTHESGIHLPRPQTAPRFLTLRLPSSSSPQQAADMLRPGKRGRPRYGAHLCCAAAAAFLLLLSISVLHSRLSSSPSSSSHFLHGPGDAANDSGLIPDDGDDNYALDDDRIDALDVVEEAEEAEEEDEVDEEEATAAAASRSGGYYWDHALGVRRRSFGGGPRGRRRQATDRQDDLLSAGDWGVISFASDDQPVEEEIRLKLASIRSIEDALLLKGGSSGGGGRTPSLLREGWAPWFEAKGRYLRQDRMFGSGMEKVDPRTHPLLQDPDASAFPAGLTRGDRLLQKAMWKELEKTPFLGGVPHMKRVERKALGSEKQRFPGSNSGGAATVSNVKEEPRYPDGRHWGYYPGLEEHKSFSEFMDRFFSSGRCSLTVFMIWNSPPWAYSVRHQRGLESLLHHHRDACVVVFSETMELNFFKDFVKDGFKIAVAMPNLDELLKDTPAQVFASVWYEWRKTQHYPIHYSELIRLAALYKYGGIYLDSDVIILKPLYSLKNSVGIEGEMSGNRTFNGAVMAFEKQSPIILECLKEFYSTYDDTLLRWNGAELLTRVITRLADGVDKLHLQLKLNTESSHSFFPISAQNITRYFSAPVGHAESNEQDLLLAHILNTSIAFHFWNGLTSSLVPETNSLVEKLLNRYCLHCSDVL
ncbi:hypothetical protein Taro_041724 [Colocasia esculenta]|uniref:Alpha 1,4-glycosyltransferase domain-containing protein n=1 Tax=Colocasia esculenta TaxID=4460 RepID=A0A843WQP7_COLES|nr:hypothetical protein [Colocasia esculenta]